MAPQHTAAKTQKVRVMSNSRSGLNHLTLSATTACFWFHLKQDRLQQKCAKVTAYSRARMAAGTKLVLSHFVSLHRPEGRGWSSLVIYNHTSYVWWLSGMQRLQGRMCLTESWPKQFGLRTFLNPSIAVYVGHTIVTVTQTPKWYTVLSYYYVTKQLYRK